MIEQIITQAMDCWELIYPGTQSPPKVNYLLHSRNQIILFYFATDGDRSHPVLISKIARTKNDNYKLRNSAKLVQRLRNNLKPNLLNSIPVIAVAGEIEGLTHIIMNYLPGSQIMTPKLHRSPNKSIETDLVAFSTWLTEFQRQTFIEYQTWDKAEWEEFFIQRLDPIILNFNLPNLKSKWFEIVASNLSNNPIPLAWGFGDAHPSNFLINKQAISGVVDWMGLTIQDFVFCDWFYFLLSYCIEIYKKNYRLPANESIEMALNAFMGITNHWLTRIFAQLTSSFLHGYNIQPDITLSLIMAFLTQLYWPVDKSKLMQVAVRNYFSDGSIYNRDIVRKLT